MTGFYILSGYTLFFVYHDRRISNIKELGRFYKKRFFGIMPLYYFSATLYVLFFSAETVKQNILLFPIELLGLQSTYSSLFIYSHNGGTWFISCLIICYLFYPLLQIISTQIKVKIKLVLIAVSSFILILSPFVVHFFHLSSIYSNPFFRVLEFSIGVFAASLSLDVKEKKYVQKVLFNRITIILEFLFIIIFVSICAWKGISGNYMLFNIGTLIPFALIIFGLGNISYGRVLNNSIVRYLSSISYAFFLSQLFMPRIGKYIFNKFPCENLMRIFVLFLICVIISVLLHELIEKPIGKLLRKKKII